MTQDSPATKALLRHVLVDTNSFGVVVTCEIVTICELLLTTATCRAALVMPTVVVLKTRLVVLKTRLGVPGTVAVPLTVMLGFVAALDSTVSVAEREPALSGVKLAVIVQVALALTVTAEPAPTQLPDKSNSVAFAPLFSIPLISSGAVPELVSVIDAGLGVGVVTKIGVDAKLNVVPLAVIAGAWADAAPAATRSIPQSVLRMISRLER
jgi:hypothetical protein